MTHATTKSSMISVECMLAAHRKVYTVSGAWPFHESAYLRTPADAPLDYAELHKDMRRHGIDWFSPTSKKSASRKPLSAAHKASITVGMMRGKHWSRGVKLGERAYHWRNKKDKPRMKEWAITTTNDFLIVTNLSAWCRTVGIDYRVVKGKLRYNSWPYVPRPNLNIQSIGRYSK